MFWAKEMIQCGIRILLLYETLEKVNTFVSSPNGSFSLILYNGEQVVNCVCEFSWVPRQRIYECVSGFGSRNKREKEKDWKSLRVMCISS